jgi:hypothetical protein
MLHQVMMTELRTISPHGLVRTGAVVLLLCASYAALAQNSTQGSFPFLSGNHTAVGPTMRILASAGASVSGVVAGQSHRIEWTTQGHILMLSRPTAVAPAEELPTTSLLYQNFPNPFNLETTVRYAIAEPSVVRIAVYNLLGQAIAVLEEGDRPAGAHQRTFDAGRLSTGVYYYRLEARSKRSATVFTSTRQMILMK